MICCRLAKALPGWLAISEPGRAFHVNDAAVASQGYLIRH